jgi:Protein of unknown function (DUF3105)
VRGALVVVACAALVVLAIGGWLLFANSRDDAGVGAGASPAGPGRLQPDRGRRHLPAGEHVPLEGLTDPPTSGAHHDRLVTREGQLDPNEIIHALELGDVIFFYGSAKPPAGLERVQEDVSGPFDAEVAAAGQQVILARRPGTRGVVAAAWRRLLRTGDGSDPRLSEFADAWLGVGAG